MAICYQVYGGGMPISRPNRDKPICVSYLYYGLGFYATRIIQGWAIDRSFISIAQ